MKCNISKIVEAAKEGLRGKIIALNVDIKIDEWSKSTV